MQTVGRTISRWQRALWVVGLVLCSGCGSESVFTVQPPRIMPVAVNYLRDLVKWARPPFPSSRLLVLLPADKRQAYPVKLGGALPASQDNTAILGIWGFNSREGIIRVNSLRLGSHYRMKAGIPHKPDMPRAIFTLTNLEHLVQDALEDHFHEAGFPVQKVNFTVPDESAAASEPAHYAVGCA